MRTNPARQISRRNFTKIPGECCGHLSST